MWKSQNTEHCTSFLKHTAHVTDSSDQTSSWEDKRTLLNWKRTGKESAVIYLICLPEMYWKGVKKITEILSNVAPVHSSETIFLLHCGQASKSLNALTGKQANIQKRVKTTRVWRDVRDSRAHLFRAWCFRQPNELKRWVTGTSNPTRSLSSYFPLSL